MNLQVKKKRKSRSGNSTLKKHLVIAALGASKTKKSFFHSKHNSLRYHTGSYNKATVAIANKLARVVYKIIKDEKVHFKDLGSDRGDVKLNQAKRLAQKLKKMGYDIKLEQVQ